MKNDNLEKINLLGVGFTASPHKKILEYIDKSLKNTNEKYYIVTPNPELLMLARDNAEYKKILNEAKIALADGVGVTIASRLLGKGHLERLAGVDLVDFLSREASVWGFTTGYLGAQANVAEETADCLQKKYSGLKVSFAKNELKDIKKMPKTDILFVAFGSPKQEIWIKSNLSKLPVKIAVGVGGSFDMISGRVPRAPKLIRDLGFEWLFRLIIQPWRIKRQLKLISFSFWVFKESLKRYIA